VGVADEAYGQSNRATVKMRSATTEFMDAVQSILIPTVFLSKKEGGLGWEHQPVRRAKLRCLTAVESRIVSLSEPPRCITTWFLPSPKRRHPTHLLDRLAMSP